MTSDELTIFKSVLTNQLALYAWLFGPRIDAVRALESNAASVGDVIPVFWRASKTCKELAAMLIGAGYPFDAAEYAVAARALHDCETLRFFENEYRVLAAMLTPSGASLWREKRDGAGSVATHQIRDLFHVGRMTDRTIEILAESLPLIRVIEAEYDVAIEAVAEIESDKADRAAARWTRAQVAEDEAEVMGRAAMGGLRQLEQVAAEQLPQARDAVAQRRAAVPRRDLRDSDSDSESMDAGSDDSSDSESEDTAGVSREEEEDELEDGPADDLLTGLDDEPVEVRELIQRELEPQYEDAVHERARELRSAESMQKAAERQLRLLVDDMNGRYEIIDEDASVPRHLNPDLVVQAFRAWLNLTPSLAMSAALAQDSLAELWDAFEREYRHLGYGELSVVARHVLALPASEAHVERLNKILRRICRKAGPRLGARQKLARLIIAA
jgi:hypothetical protein